jgi:glyoxylase-like metal-dependent hydrolase (beta-lactamase superfamily II)
MSDPTVIPLVDEGLGNSSYLVDLGDGRALAVDPSRDLRALRMAAQRQGLRIGFVAETHLHADFRLARASSTRRRCRSRRRRWPPVHHDDG